jgi:periplasmic protein TonB
MAFFNSTSEKKSFIISSAIFILLMLVIFLYRFQDVDRSSMFQGGGEIAIRFGQHEMGSGPIKPAELVATSPEIKPSAPQPPTEVKVTTQNQVQTQVVKSSETPNKTKTNSTVPNKSTTTTSTAQPNKSTTDALNSILKGPSSQGARTTGSGDDGVAGNKGRLDGDPYSNSYYGSGRGQGIGGGNSWGLNGRSLTGHNTFQQECNESGTVVVQVNVDRQGRVTNAKLSLDGTTNTDPCLVNPALRTARSFKWKADDNAPASQIGFVVIKFKVGT